MRCSFPYSNHQQHQVRQNENRKQISFWAFKNSFLVNIKSISIKEVNLSTKGHRHILKGQSKNEKLLKKNSFETILRYSFEIKFETSTKYRAWFNASSSTPIEKYPCSNKNIEIDVLHHWYYLSPITFVTIWNQQCFKYQNLWPLTLLECAICKPVFPRTTNL